MDFLDQLKQFSKRVETLKNDIETEEATKTAIIMPFFAMLGYDVFNPSEFMPEFTADIGIKKGEKVDYAIIKDNKPVILVECKSITENLERHGSQLFRYFGTSEAKFAILTNGIIYQFYTDLDEPNKMDETPFLEVNILEIKEHEVYELKKFSKSTFEIDSIFNSASILKYENEFKHILASQLEKPNDDFVRLFLQNVYSGVKTQSVIDKFRPILKKALNDFINETMNDKIKTALGGGDSNSTSSNSSDIDDKNSPNDSDSDSKAHTKKIVTTEDELEAYFIVKNILKDIVGMNDITYKDTESYFNILYKANIRKWICRLKITSMQKILMLPDENKKITKIPISNLYEILNYKEQLIDILKRYL